MSLLNFDARTVEPAKAPEAVPTAWYNVRIVASETKPTAKNDGHYLELTEEIIDGEYAGSRVYDRLNLANSNPVAVEIAFKQLSAICHATGVIQVQDSQQLHGIPMMARVVYRPAGKGNDGKEYDASNDVKGYKPIQSGVQGGAPAFAAPAQPSFAPPPQPSFAPPVAPQGWAPPAPAAVAPAAAAPQPWAPQAPAPAAAAPQPWAPPAAPAAPPAPAPAPQQWTPPSPAATAAPATPPWATPAS